MLEETEPLMRVLAGSEVLFKEKAEMFEGGISWKTRVF